MDNSSPENEPLEALNKTLTELKNGGSIDAKAEMLSLSVMLIGDAYSICEFKAAAEGDDSPGVHSCRENVGNGVESMIETFKTILK